MYVKLASYHYNVRYSIFILRIESPMSMTTSCVNNVNVRLSCQMWILLFIILSECKLD